MILFYTILLAHLIADFVQPAALVKWTKRSVAGLLVHTGVYFILSLIVLFGYGPYWWFWLIVLGFSHFVLDRFKIWLNEKVSYLNLYVFVLDQILHVAVIAGVVALAGFADFGLSPFLRLVSKYAAWLPIITAYIIATFGASVLVFEAGRTLSASNSDRANNIVISFKDRLLGMFERALAVTLLLTELYFLAPLSFVFSIRELVRRWGGKAGEKHVAELVTSALVAFVIGLLLRIYGY
jgi:hypothetical protein